MAKDDDPPLKVIEDTPPKGSLANFKITACSDVTPSGVTLQLEGLAGNNPELYKNTIAVFSGVGPSPSQEPEKVVAITKSSMPNRFDLEFAFGPSDYSLTYQVAGAGNADPSVGLETMCAVAFIYKFPMAAAAPITNVSMTIRAATASSLKVQYFVLPNYDPVKYQNWIGIWEGTPNANSALPEPTYTANVSSSSNVGFVSLKNLNLYTDFPYTMIYFMAPRSSGLGTGDTKAGAVLYFSLADEGA